MHHLRGTRFWLAAATLIWRIVPTATGGSDGGLRARLAAAPLLWRVGPTATGGSDSGIMYLRAGLAAATVL